MEKFSASTQWFMLLAVSLVLGFGLQFYHVPAALLLGPMLVGVVMGLNGAAIRIPRTFFYASNAVLGCLVAQSLSLSILTPLMKEWPLVVFILLSTLIASGLSGWLLMRYSELPGTTGTWGASPGGASAMVAMASDFGADVRLVAFMQYLRVLMVTASAAFVARASLGPGAEANNALLVWFPTLDWRFPGTLAMAFSCAWVGRLLRIPSGQLLVPMIVGSLLHSSGIMTLQTPEWLLAVAYALIGWSVGLSFTRPVFLLALRTLPKNDAFYYHAHAAVWWDGADADASAVGGYADRLSGNQPRRAGFYRHYCRWQPGGYRVCDGAADDASVHYPDFQPDLIALHLASRGGWCGVAAAAYRAHRA
ncbi:hypothetical protein OS11_21550 [Dickeya oryzae]